MDTRSSLLLPDTESSSPLAYLYYSVQQPNIWSSHLECTCVLGPIILDASFAHTFPRSPPPPPAAPPQSSVNNGAAGMLLALFLCRSSSSIDFPTFYNSFLLQQLQTHTKYVAIRCRADPTTAVRIYRSSQFAAPLYTAPPTMTQQIARTRHAPVSSLLIHKSINSD